jgi:hypothetical protein
LTIVQNWCKVEVAIFKDNLITWKRPSMPDESNESRLARIESLYNQGLKHAAAQLSRLVLEKDPTNVPALVWLAKSTSQPDEADKATRRASTLQPDDPQVRELVALRQPSYAGAANYNPYSAPSPGFSNAPEPKGGAQPWPNNFSAAPQPGYVPNPQGNSYDYLKNLSATVQPSVPPATPVGNVKVKTSVSLPGLIFGLLFLIVGLGLAAYWSYLVIDYSTDLSQTASQLQGQIVRLSSAQLVADVKDQGQRTFDVNDQISKNLVPLVSDNKPQGGSLVPNKVVLNVTPKGRLASVDVITPTRGHADGNNGLLGYGQALDWVVTAVGGILAIVGLILLGRTLGKRRT